MVPEGVSQSGRKCLDVSKVTKRERKSQEESFFARAFW